MDEAIYRILLRCYPRRFRERFGEEMLAAFRKMQVHLGRLQLWRRLLRDWLWTLQRAWLQERILPFSSRIFQVSAMTHWLHDLKFSFRSLRRSPRMPMLAFATLALGMGAAASIFSVVDAVLLRPLPFPGQERLVMIWETQAEEGQFHERPSPGALLFWEREAKSFQALGGWAATNPPTLGPREGMELVEAALVTQGFFGVLGLTPLKGRFFEPSDVQGASYGPAGNHVSGPQVVVVAESLWRTRLGARQDVVGSTLEIGQKPFTVIGVVQDRLNLPGDQAQIWLPWDLDVSFTSRYGSVPHDFRFLNLVARLQTGATIEQAESELTALMESLAQSHPETNRGWSARLTFLREEILAGTQNTLALLSAAVGIALLIACSNVAALLLARASARAREWALRCALGASSGRLLRQILIESLCLSLPAALAAVGLAYLLLPALLALAPEGIPRIEGVVIDQRVLLFCLASGLATGLLCGLIPAWQTLGSPSADHLRGASRPGAVSQTGQRIRKWLVVGEIALAVLLLAGAGLLLRSLVSILAVDPGFNPDRLISFGMNLDAERYGRGKANPFYQRLVEEIGSLAGVDSASAVTRTPMAADMEFLRPYRIPAQADRGGERPRAAARIALPGYFQTMGIPLLGGRDFQESDRMGAPLVTIVDQALAQSVWPGQDPIGKRIIVDTVGQRGEFEYQVIGLVPPTRYLGLKSPSAPQIIFAHAQIPYLPMYIVVRAKGKTAPLFESLRRTALQLDPAQPSRDMRLMEERISSVLSADRFAALLFTLLAGLALVLAVVGTYAALHFLAGLRRHEMGVRMALGAARRDVMRLIVGESARMAAAGVILGLGSALILSEGLRGMLYQIEPNDPLSLLGSALMLFLVALAAAYFPARQAARSDPLETLRAE